MSKMGFSATVLVTSAVISLVSCFGAASEPVTAPGKKIASTESTARSRDSATQVYLVRGFLNVFSLGMDSLAAELRHAGISATVTGYNDWQAVAEEIAANYKAGRRGPIVLVGHSFGADAVMFMADSLGQMGVPVALVIPFDGTYAHAASANVARVLNIYKSEAKITPGPGFHGELTNYYVTDANITHTNIDDDSRLHMMAINKIRGTRNVRSAASPTPKTPG
jgi:hypothetical protein